jgi:hypothetical protein
VRAGRTIEIAVALVASTPGFAGAFASVRAAAVLHLGSPKAGVIEAGRVGTRFLRAAVTILSRGGF